MLKETLDFNIKRQVLWFPSCPERGGRKGGFFFSVFFGGIWGWLPQDTSCKKSKEISELELFFDRSIGLSAQGCSLGKVSVFLWSTEGEGSIVLMHDNLLLKLKRKRKTRQ